VADFLVVKGGDKRMSGDIGPSASTICSTILETFTFALRWYSGVIPDAGVTLDRGRAPSRETERTFPSYLSMYVPAGGEAGNRKKKEAFT
jgi:hypothetical protein